MERLIAIATLLLLGACAATPGAPDYKPEQHFRVLPPGPGGDEVRATNLALNRDGQRPADLAN